jgi:hypothetical protein
MPTAIPRWRTNHCDANEQMHQSKCERGWSQRRTDIADAKHQAAQHDRDHDAEVVAQPSHCDTAKGDAHHCKRIGRGSVGTGAAEISLHEWQSDRHRPQTRRRMYLITSSARSSNVEILIFAT